MQGRPRPPLDLGQALDFIDRTFQNPPVTDLVKVEKSLGRWSATDVHAPRDLPRFPCSAMDGYALKSSGPAQDQPEKYVIGQTITAGMVPRPLFPGEAARIFTGALMPTGADRVIMQEDATLHGAVVALRHVPGAKPHIRPVGEDVSASEIILPAEARIGPGQIALMSAVGVSEVQALRPPRVAVLSTGDELVPAGMALGPAQIHDTNRPMLCQMIAGLGCEVTDLGICGDNRDHILRLLIDAAASHDLIVPSGGASVGVADHLTGMVRQRGCLEFWKLAMRPGKPVGFGDIDDCPILVLPGNPVAAAVDFALLGRPLIARLTGLRRDLPKSLRLPFSGTHAKPAGRTDVLLGRLEPGLNGQTSARPLARQGSANLAALGAAEVLIVLTPDKITASNGDLVEVVPLWDTVPYSAGRPNG